MIARMALTSASTFADAQAQISNSLRWEYQATTSMAQDFIEAVLWIQTHRADVSADGTSMRFPNLDSQLARAQNWVAARDLARRPRFVMGREGRPSSTRPWA